MAAAALVLVGCGDLLGSHAAAGPTFDAIDPRPPSSRRRPLLAGRAERGAVVTVYASATCTTEPVGMGWASAVTGRFELPALAAPNAETVFHAIATDGAGGVSPCTPGPSYVHDDQAPPPPLLLGLSPDGISSVATPVLLGAAEPSATVRIFAKAGCAGPAVAEVAVPATGDFEVLVAAAPDTTSDFSARATDVAGNTSDCAEGPSYRHDGIPPEAPVLLGFTPPMGPGGLSPLLAGRAEPGASVTLHADPECASPPVARADAGADGGFTWLAAIEFGSTISLWARAIDAAGNASACSAREAAYSVTTAVIDFSTSGCHASGKPIGGLSIDIFRATPAEFLMDVLEVRCAPEELRIGPQGLIVEDARINGVIQSARIDDPAWTLWGTSCEVRPDVMRAPDGAVSMDLLDATAGRGGDARCQVVATASTGSFAASAWAVAVSGTTSATVRAACAPGVAPTRCTCSRSDGGSCNATVLPDACAASAVVGTIPVRLTAGVECSALSAAAAICLEPGAPDSGPGIAAFWGAQLEAGALFATSHVPTGSSTEARAADVVSMPGLSPDLMASGWATLSPEGEPSELGTVLDAGGTADGMALRWHAGRPRLAWAGQFLDHDVHAAPGRRGTITVGWAVAAERACLYWDGVEKCGAALGMPSAATRAYLGSSAGGTPPFLHGAVGSLHLGERPTVARNPTALLVLGDSLSAPASTFCPHPWPAAVVNGLGAPWLVTNDSVNGAVTSHLLARWRGYADNGHGVVAVLGGTNDLVLAEPASQIFARLRAIYDEARLRGKRVVPITIPPSAKFSGYLDKWRTLNDMIRAYCLEQRLACADIEPRMNSGTDGLAPQYDSGDHKHFNQAGCDLVASIVADVIR